MRSLSEAGYVVARQWQREDRVVGRRGASADIRSFAPDAGSCNGCRQRKPGTFCKIFRAPAATDAAIGRSSGWRQQAVISRRCLGLDALPMRRALRFRGLCVCCRSAHPGCDCRSRPNLEKQDCGARIALTLAAGCVTRDRTSATPPRDSILRSMRARSSRSNASTAVLAFCSSISNADARFAINWWPSALFKLVLNRHFASGFDQRLTRSTPNAGCKQRSGRETVASDLFIDRSSRPGL